MKPIGMGSPRWCALLAIAAVTAGLPARAWAQGHHPPAAPQLASSTLQAKMAHLPQVDSALALYLHGLASDFDTSEAASDAQWLMNADLSRGPYALLQPRKGAAAFTHGRVRRGEFLAHLKLSGPYVLSIAALAPDTARAVTLPAGNSYLYVDSSTALGRWQITLVQDTVGFAPIWLPCRHSPGRPVRAARIKVARPGGFDDTICFPCNGGWCCAEY